MELEIDSSPSPDTQCHLRLLYRAQPWRSLSVEPEVGARFVIATSDYDDAIFAGLRDALALAVPGASLTGTPEEPCIVGPQRLGLDFVYGLRVYLLWLKVQAKDEWALCERFTHHQHYRSRHRIEALHCEQIHLANWLRFRKFSLYLTLQPELAPA